MTTGERIRQLRIEHQMTQEELGAKVGVQKAAIYKYENGLVVNLKRSILEKLALVLDTTPTYLMGMEDAEPTQASLTKAQTSLLSVFDIRRRRCIVRYKISFANAKARKK